MKIKDRENPQIKNSDVVTSYIGLLCQGKSDFEDIQEMHEDKEFYKDALNTKKIPSSVTLRQRMDLIRENFRNILLEENVRILKSTNAEKL